MAEPQLIRLIGERRKRLVATIMGHAEREFFSQLSAQQQAEFRKRTLGAIDEFADLMRDVVKITSDTTVVNDHAIVLLEQIHATQGAIAKALSH